jgi:maltodextrin utilization protein YvdJ
MLSRLCEHILCENKINYRATTFPGAVWNHLEQDVHKDFESALDLWSKCSEIVDKNYMTVSNFVFITSNNINFIEKINDEQHIYLMKNSQMVNKYDKEKLTIVNYDNYRIADELSIKKEIETYSKNLWYSWYRIYDNMMFYQLVNIIEALNKEALNFFCAPYFIDIKNIPWKERNEFIEQFVLCFYYV